MQLAELEDRTVRRFDASRVSYSTASFQYLVTAIFESAAADLDIAKRFVERWGVSSPGVKGRVAALSPANLSRIQKSANDVILSVSGIKVFIGSDWAGLLAIEITNNPESCLAALMSRVDLAEEFTNRELRHLLDTRPKGRGKRKIK